MTNSADEDLVASKTEGFKVGEKKTIEEYAKLGRAFTCIIRVVFDIINFKERFGSYNALSLVAYEIVTLCSKYDASLVSYINSCLSKTFFALRGPIVLGPTSVNPSQTKKMNLSIGGKRCLVLVALRLCR